MSGRRRRLGETGRALAADESHMAMARRIARHVAWKFSLPIEDAISAAYLGLCHAAADYETGHAISFDAWARLGIRSAIMDEFKSQRRRGRRESSHFSLQHSEIDPVARGHAGCEGMESAEAFEALIADLSEDSKHVLRVMFRECDGKNNETARVLGRRSARISEITRKSIDQIRKRLAV